MTSKPWNTFKNETAIDPERPIIDPHHHIFSAPKALFDPSDFEDLLADKTDMKKPLMIGKALWLSWQPARISR